MSECAAEQGRFWDFHTALFQTVERSGLVVFAENRLTNIFKLIGLDVTQLDICYTNQKHLDSIRADLEGALELGKGPVRTPTVFINGTAYTGFQTFDFYKTRIEKALLQN